MEWWWLWVVIAAVVVFIVWAVRRAEGHGGMSSIHVPRQRSSSGSKGKPVGGKRRAR